MSNNNLRPMKNLPEVYLARAGKYGEDEELALENQLAVIGWHEIPSLEKVKNCAEMAELVRHKYPEVKPRAAAQYAGQLWTFAHGIQLDDIVVLPRKLTSQIALGRVTGPYQYIEVNSQHRHTRRVKWLQD